MQKINTLTAKTLSLALAASLLFSCQPENKTATAEVTDTTTVNIQNDIKAAASELPSPVELVNHLSFETTAYNKEMLHNTKAADKYYGDEAMAGLNLGIYMIDIGYAAAYGQVQDALDRMNTAKKLSSDLNILEAYDRNIVTRFEANLENKDSLLNIVRESFTSTEAYLKKSERPETAAYIFAGSWIEGMYLSTQLADKFTGAELTKKQEAMVAQIGNQKESLNKLVLLLEKMEQNQQTTALLASLKDMQRSFDKVIVNPKAADATVDIADIKDAGEVTDIIVESVSSKVSVPAETLKAIIAKTKVLRDRVTTV